jgi:hypothetical protein
VRDDQEAPPSTFDPRPLLREAVGELAELDHEMFSYAADRIKGGHLLYQGGHLLY